MTRDQLARKLRIEALKFKLRNGELVSTASSWKELEPFHKAAYYQMADYILANYKKKDRPDVTETEEIRPSSPSEPVNAAETTHHVARRKRTVRAPREDVHAHGKDATGVRRRARPA